MSLTTSGDICIKAAQMIGAYDSTTSLTGADGTLLLDLLNSMMDEWSNYTLACYEIAETSVVLTPGKASYTIGTAGADITATRPLKILTDPGTAYAQDSNGNNYPIEVVPQDRWNLLANRSSIITSNFPTVLFYDPQMPLGVVNISPYPNLPYTMFFDSMLQLGQFSTLAAQLSLPPGYAIAMFSNLAELAHPFFFDGDEAPAKIRRIAGRTLGAIKRTNQRDIYAQYDSEIVARGQIGYNIYTDSVGSTLPT